MMDCATLLAVGSNFPYSQFLPGFEAGEPTARAVQIDVDPTMIGLRYPFEVNLVGDAAATLRSSRCSAVSMIALGGRRWNRTCTVGGR